MAGFKLAPRLEERVAVMVADDVHDIAEEVEREAKNNAPAVKRWVSMRDGAVRDQHVAADGMMVPLNARFALESYEWDKQHRGVGDKTYLLYPRDETGLAYVAIVNCRCWTELDHDAIRSGIKAERPVVTGKKVTSAVVSEGDMVVEAEKGDVYDATLGIVAEGTRYMAKAAATVAVRRRNEVRR